MVHRCWRPIYKPVGMTGIALSGYRNVCRGLRQGILSDVTSIVTSRALPAKARMTHSRRLE